MILSSDCHNAKDIAEGYGVAAEVIRRARYREMWVLGRGGEMLETTAV